MTSKIERHVLTFINQTSIPTTTQAYRLNEFREQVQAIRTGLTQVWHDDGYRYSNSSLDNSPLNTQQSHPPSRLLYQTYSQVLPARLLPLLTWEELEALVCGSPEVDVDLLEELTDYHACSPEQDHVKFFWAVLRWVFLFNSEIETDDVILWINPKTYKQCHTLRPTLHHSEDFTPAERALFVRFVWGRSRLPLRSEQFRQRFKLQSFHAGGQDGNGSTNTTTEDQYLPVAHTCFFSCELPRYSSRAVCAERLRYAVHHCCSIDLDQTALGRRAASLGWDG